MEDVEMKMETFTGQHKSNRDFQARVTAALAQVYRELAMPSPFAALTTSPTPPLSASSENQSYREVGTRSSASSSCSSGVVVGASRSEDKSLGLLVRSLEARLEENAVEEQMVQPISVF